MVAAFLTLDYLIGSSQKVTINMQNLIKIQEELKNVPLQAVMSYVDGRNPMVPPYLALTELNRRKQIQQSAQAQQQPQATVKDQIQQQAGIMALQNQRAQQGMENMQQNAGRVPQPGAVPMNAPVQAQPAQMPVVKAATGGLMGNVGESESMYAPQGVMQLPTPGMFQQRNFAGGGIVAFSGKDRSSVEDEELTEEEKKALEENRYLQRSRAVANFPKALVEGIEKYNPITGSAFREGIRNIINESPEDQAKRFRAASMRPEGAPSAVPTATERVAARDAKAAQDLANFDAATALYEKERATKLAAPTAVAETKPPVVKPPVVENKGITTVPPKKDIYEQEADRLAQLKERFGVKDNVSSASDQMIADLRKRIDEQRGQQGIEAIAAGMIKGGKGKKWYDALGGYGEGYFETAGKQRDLNNKQDESFANLQIAREKEDDARRRNDVKAVQEAVEKTRKAEIDVKNAESNRIQAMKPSQFAEQVKLFNENPALYAKMFPKENPLVVAAAKEYFEKEQLYKKEYPTVQDYLRAKGLSASGDATVAAGPKEGDKSTSKSGKPIIYKNGKWEYA
jgi:hypothetical protein